MPNAVVAGVDMTKFVKPGMQEPYRVMASRAIKGAIEEAGIDPTLIQQAYGSYIYGDSGGAQIALYDNFMTGIPIVNVSNNCSSGSTALFLARQAVESGAVDCALAFGFEEMEPGALGTRWPEREYPSGVYADALGAMGYPEAPVGLRMFGAAGDHYMRRYGVSSDIFAKVAVKTRRHAERNPLALLNAPLTVDEVLESKIFYLDYLTRLMCCPPSCGAAAAVICSKDFASRHGISGSVEIIGQAMATDRPIAWEDPIALVGADASRRAAAQAYEQAGVGPDDVQLVELHDCFTPNEVLTYEALGLCEAGGALRLVEDGDNSYGGKFVVNPSGGLMSKGHPIGATGLAQCYELCNQLRHRAGPRQVEDARIALQHNIGVPGAAVVTLYRLA
ncbi:thiolase C-terminal domain-containing protein [Rhizorhabdus dicambivorans]|uniref:propanoyl-CoA C-acyltransferase n=1 Tax=Rhizorhabdus dicambivorans TaxID=1850238 RepID=A0A2A4FWS7_9SPHN|nr:lipid-transfer protein [Rhizorhabdus dicambivorans]ATE65497.1 lipid-transfer protein [Rhizorhabdus dicambivorans]PCE41841.1 lipid-transfer protein [Rhizorhabdus dicambivorans]